MNNTIIGGRRQPVDLVKRYEDLRKVGMIDPKAISAGDTLLTTLKSANVISATARKIGEYAEGGWNETLGDKLKAHERGKRIAKDRGYSDGEFTERALMSIGRKNPIPLKDTTEDEIVDAFTPIKEVVKKAEDESFEASTALVAPFDLLTRAERKKLAKDAKVVLGYEIGENSFYNEKTYNNQIALALKTDADRMYLQEMDFFSMKNVAYMVGMSLDITSLVFPPVFKLLGGAGKTFLGMVGKSAIAGGVEGLTKAGMLSLYQHWTADQILSEAISSSIGVAMMGGGCHGVKIGWGRMKLLREGRALDKKIRARDKENNLRKELEAEHKEMGGDPSNFSLSHSLTNRAFDALSSVLKTNKGLSVKQETDLKVFIDDTSGTIKEQFRELLLSSGDTATNIQKRLLSNIMKHIEGRTDLDKASKKFMKATALDYFGRNDVLGKFNVLMEGVVRSPIQKIFLSNSPTFRELGGSIFEVSFKTGARSKGKSAESDIKVTKARTLKYEVENADDFNLWLESNDLVKGWKNAWERPIFQKEYEKLVIDRIRDVPSPSRFSQGRNVIAKRADKWRSAIDEVLDEAVEKGRMTADEAKWWKENKNTLVRSYDKGVVANDKENFIDLIYREHYYKRTKKAVEKEIKSLEEKMAKETKKFDKKPEFKKLEKLKQEKEVLEKAIENSKKADISDFEQMRADALAKHETKSKERLVKLKNRLSNLETKKRKGWEEKSKKLQETIDEHFFETDITATKINERFDKKVSKAEPKLDRKAMAKLKENAKKIKAQEKLIKKYVKEPTRKPFGEKEKSQMRAEAKADALASAKNAYNEIVNGKDGVAGMTMDSYSNLPRRSIDIPDKLLAKYLDNDAKNNVLSFLDKFNNYNALHHHLREFGGKKGALRMLKLEEEQMLKQNPNDTAGVMKGYEYLRKEFEDYLALLDGSLLHRSDGNVSNWKGWDFFHKWAGATKLGLVVINSFGDSANLIVRQNKNLKKFFSDKEFRQAFKEFKSLSDKEAIEAGIGLDGYSADVFMRIHDNMPADFSSNFNSSLLNQNMKRLGNGILRVSNLASLMPMWQNAMRKSAYRFSVTRLASELYEGVDLKHLGINSRDAVAIKKQLDQFAKKTEDGHVVFANKENWTDNKAKHAFTDATLRLVDGTVVVPSRGDVPLAYQATRFGRFLGTFQKFIYSVLNKLVLPVMQEGMSELGALVLLTVAIQAVGSELKDKIRGKKDAFNVYRDNFFSQATANGFAGSGLLGKWFGMFPEIASQLMDDDIKWRKIVDNQIKSKTLGASADLVTNGIGGFLNMFSGDFKQAGKAMARTIPMQNNLFLQWLLNNTDAFKEDKRGKLPTI